MSWLSAGECGLLSALREIPAYRQAGRRCLAGRIVRWTPPSFQPHPVGGSISRKNLKRK